MVTEHAICVGHLGNLFACTSKNLHFDREVILLFPLPSFSSLIITGNKSQIQLENESEFSVEEKIFFVEISLR